MFGPPGLETYWQGFLQSIAPDIEDHIAHEGRRDFYDLFPLAHLSEARDLDIEGVLVTALQTGHPTVEHGDSLRLDEAEHSVVLAGDPAPLPRIADFVRGTGQISQRHLEHLLRSHVPASEVGRAAQETDVGALAFCPVLPAGPHDGPDSRLRAEIARFYSGPVFVGHDGMVIDLTDGA